MELIVALVLGTATPGGGSPVYGDAEQARETTLVNTVAAAPRPELLHPGVRRYLNEAGIRQP